ncbi:peptidoglycan recognition protein family protein [Sphingomonas bacterium]|uniref:peptidoglycan recognition protein family protein n=1 Tax=Sphingomonas bacterium TaxID=1895847 RepID=UPI00157538CA|nr:N-acetylmuramoyl-L-alanine amidase [Sphingomonas bacterium]
MAQCPFATQHPISGSSGSNLTGPYRIVHHTTEGASAAGAFAAFARGRSDPHFTVDHTSVYQHIDTGVAGRALVHAKGEEETNRASAVQIEVVGFAGAPKNPQTLRNVARLCRWIEDTHGVSRTWPSGLPRPPVDGADPGGHNRDPKIWATQGGHYGHCHVPENVHWDPAYTRLEVEYVMGAAFDADGHLTNPGDPAIKALASRPVALDATEPAVMTDHADVGGDDDGG